ncbi:hypothetical protein HMPREF9396_0860 [Streptococcus sanguinis SK1059]|uniref:Uncharacterized protein n=1 Tax=Streptococcus sanguinis TaxID=1305 RepID=A0A2X3XIT3_STRSA|nr:hypothetical protein HMPREF9396_0860 [Streptococcus sanguinis SK1059]EGQ23840.1 hypothetical protein HMPREF9387_1405 [Streptococcus sanguinis SK340]SQF34632.1 Uncharacterised protein [Streptococcus sanguinis]
MILRNDDTSTSSISFLFFLIEKLKSSRYKDKKKSSQLAEMIRLANIN